MRGLVCFSPEPVTVLEGVMVLHGLVCSVIVGSRFDTSSVQQEMHSLFVCLFVCMFIYLFISNRQ